METAPWQQVKKKPKQGQSQKRFIELNRVDGYIQWHPDMLIGIFAGEGHGPGNLSRGPIITTSRKTAQYDYGAFKRIADIWFACRHKGVMFLPDDEEVTETSYIDNLEVNVPVAERMFNAQAFLKDVEFVETFNDIYRE